MEINLLNEIGLQGTGPKAAGKAAVAQQAETGGFSFLLASILDNQAPSNGMTPVSTEGSAAANESETQDSQPVETEAVKAEAAVANNAIMEPLSMPASDAGLLNSTTNEPAISTLGRPASDVKLSDSATDVAASNDGGEDDTNDDKREIVPDNGIAALVHALKSEGANVFVHELTPANVPAHAIEMHARAAEAGFVAAGRVQQDAGTEGQQIDHAQSAPANSTENGKEIHSKAMGKGFEIPKGLSRQEADSVDSAPFEKASKGDAPAVAAAPEKAVKNETQPQTAQSPERVISFNVHKTVENADQPAKDHNAENKENLFAFQAVQPSSGDRGREGSFERHADDNKDAVDTGVSIDQQAAPAPSASFREIMDAPTANDAASNLKVMEIAPEVHEKLQSGIRMSVERGGGEVKMKLHPESLGELTIKLNVENGSVKAEITVSSHAVKAAIEADSGGLKEALGNHGLSLDKCVVEVGRSEARNDTKAPDSRQGFSDSRDEQWTGRRGAQEEAWQRYKNGKAYRNENPEDGIDFFI